MDISEGGFGVLELLLGRVAEFLCAFRDGFAGRGFEGGGGAGIIRGEESDFTTIDVSDQWKTGVVEMLNRQGREVRQGWSLRSGIWDLDSGIWDLGSGFWVLGSRGYDAAWKDGFPLSFLKFWLVGRICIV